MVVETGRLVVVVAVVVAVEVRMEGQLTRFKTNWVTSGFTTLLPEKGDGGGMEVIIEI